MVFDVCEEGGLGGGNGCGAGLQEPLDEGVVGDDGGEEVAKGIVAVRDKCCSGEACFLSLLDKVDSLLRGGGGSEMVGLLVLLS